MVGRILDTKKRMRKKKIIISGFALKKGNGESPFALKTHIFTSIDPANKDNPKLRADCGWGRRKKTRKKEKKREDGKEI